MSRFALHSLRVRPRRGRPCAAPRRSALAAAALLALASSASAAPAVVPSDWPLFLVTPINPNILVMFDNSQSMDATMAGKVIRGWRPASLPPSTPDISDVTRSNIARNELRGIITQYGDVFNWGLGSFGLETAFTSTRRSIYGYYMGTASTMRYTNTCTGIVDGVGTSDVTGTFVKAVNGVATSVTGLLPCIPNPEPLATGHDYITFSRSSDDPDVNDAYYIRPSPAQIYGVGGPPSGTLDVNYYLRTRRANPDPASWTKDDFTTNLVGNEADPSPIPIGVTDAGFQVSASEFPREVYIYRGQGFEQRITGLGKINQPVLNVNAATTTQEMKTAHYQRLAALLAREEQSETTPELKNAAVNTPLAGSLQTSRDYFAGRLTGLASPIVASCQRNYVLLATDGNPTAKAAGGAPYPPEQIRNTPDGNGGYTFGAAVGDVLTEIDALRSTGFGGNTYDVQTYVIGLGDTLSNPGSLAGLNEMARRGGTSAAYRATNSAELATAFQSIVSRIESVSNASSSVALNSSSYTAGAQVYQAKFNANTWTGDLLAYPIDATGAVGATPAWRAALQVSAQDWDTGRAILTYKPTGADTGTGIAFRPAADPLNPTAGELNKAQSDLLGARLSPNPADYDLAAQRIAYLRGDTSRETRNVADRTSVNFRNRLLESTGTTSNVLGDIADSTPFYVGAPSQNYRADFEAASYPAFVRSKANRTPYLYVGANDGMLHAFNAATGREKFAYVPNLVLSSQRDGFSLLTSLTFPSPIDTSGQFPAFRHRFNVDGSPTVADVYFRGDGAWHSLLVSGLRAGGTGLFALDVTDPDAVTEATAASVVRWEFNHPALGYLHARPLVKRTNNGRWSVIVGNGYNAVGSGGTAQLFVIDAETGALIRRLDTGAGSAGSPNGLSAPVAYDTDDDDVSDVVYAGDLDGNLWKFDLGSADPAQWRVGIGGAPLFSPGSAKPITAAPDVTRHPKGGVMVAFGTGRYLGAADLSDTSRQTLYGIWDNGTETAVAAGMLQSQVIEPDMVSSAGATYRFTTHRVGPASDYALADDLVDAITRNNYLASKRGWYVDLPSSGERVVAEARFFAGRASFVTLVPSVDVCSSGGDSWKVEVDYLTGNRPDSAIFDTNNDRRVNVSDLLNVNANATLGNVASGVKIGFTTAGAAVMTTGEGMAVSLTNDAINPHDPRVVLERADPGNQVRVMWRVVE